ncbi:MFS transporter [Polycladomyces abyssicola]|jgi:MHS family shikimate/dehydroshikimate transporter-like MFS transporter|uniref:Putative proline/betaine transporter n=1 Tax=Polycladomyces abyssicola TaxID=1125966 RepID=A0A8D5UEH6_9BACL|nr:MFS transporter [Polycladomyces abyssicola]BCU80829.1 MFS transporter [Polycladomyces abyssicola]
MGQKNSEAVKSALSSFIGTAIEWYDFFLYGTAAALVFPQLFFPESDPLTGTLQAFATFTLGFVARPFGGIIFGHYGDKIGRKSMLIVTLMIMGIATALIGLLPTYESIGVWAPILLIVLRLLQGIGVGGEWGGAALMSVEHAPKGKRGFYGSWTQMGVPGGLLLSTAVFTMFSSLPEEQFLTWGWRIPFLVSFLLIGVGLFIRLRVMETPAFQKVKETGTEARLPILEVLKAQPKQVLQAMGARFAENGTFYIFSVFVLTYATEQLGMPKSMVLNGVTIATALEFIAVPLFGALSDRIGRRPVYMAGAAFTALFAFPFFWLLDTKSTFFTWLAIVIALALGHAAMYGPQAAFLSELFGTRVRYSGVSIGYQLASVFAGGLAPLIATSLMAWAGGKPWAVAVYLIFMCLVTLISVYWTSETYQNEVSEKLTVTKSISS